MNIEKNCPKCQNRMGIACKKCYECGYDYFSGFNETKALAINGVSKPLIDIHFFSGEINGNCTKCGRPQGMHDF